MELIIDSRKLSIKHYLNLNLKPSNPDGEVDMYPLYTQVIYDSKSTKFKTFASLRYLGASYFFAKSQEESVLDGSFLREMPELRDTDHSILRIVEYEVNRFKSDFALKGLGKRFQIYGSPVLSVVSDSIGLQLNHFFGSKFTYNEFVKIFGQRKPFGVLVIEALEKKPELIRVMPANLQYYSVVSGLMKHYEDSSKEQIICYDLLIDRTKKKTFYDQTQKLFRELEPDGIFAKIPEDQFDEFFSIVYDRVHEALKNTMKN